jgi:DNA-binding YbaB/EbfC family protein
MTYGQRETAVDSMDDFLAQAEEQQRRIQEAQRALERMEVSGRSRYNVVTARLRGSGQLLDIAIDPRQMSRYDAKALGGLVVEAVNDAMGRLAAASQETFAPFLAEAEAQ